MLPRWHCNSTHFSRPAQIMHHRGHKLFPFSHLYVEFELPGKTCKQIYFRVHTLKLTRQLGLKGEKYGAGQWRVARYQSTSVVLQLGSSTSAASIFKSTQLEALFYFCPDRSRLHILRQNRSIELPSEQSHRGNSDFLQGLLFLKKRHNKWIGFEISPVLVPNVSFIIEGYEGNINKWKETVSICWNHTWSLGWMPCKESWNSSVECNHRVLEANSGGSLFWENGQNV